VRSFATTVTRDAAFGGANKALAEGQTCYLESTNVVQYYDGAAWATVGPTAASGLVLIKAQTIGSAVSSVPVTDVFSSTYDNYLVTINGGVCADNDDIRMSLGATVTGYYYGGFGQTYAGAGTSASFANVAYWMVGKATPANNTASVTIQNPFLSKTTAYGGYTASHRTDGLYVGFGGYLNNTTSYTAFTIVTSGGTLTGGTIRVYGYQNS